MEICSTPLDNVPQERVGLYCSVTETKDLVSKTGVDLNT